MGLFDTLILYCPNCGKAQAYQSKAGDCGLNTYYFEDAPMEILKDIEEDDWTDCISCQTRFKIKLVHKPVFKVVKKGEEE